MTFIPFEYWPLMEFDSMHTISISHDSGERKRERENHHLRIGHQNVPRLIWWLLLCNVQQDRKKEKKLPNEWTHRKKRWQQKNWNIMIVKHLLIIKQWRCGCCWINFVSLFCTRTVYKREKLIIIDTNVSALKKVVYFRISKCNGGVSCCRFLFCFVLSRSFLIDLPLFVASEFLYTFNFVCVILFWFRIWFGSVLFVPLCLRRFIVRSQLNILICVFSFSFRCI